MYSTSLPFKIKKKFDSKDKIIFFCYFLAFILCLQSINLLLCISLGLLFIKIVEFTPDCAIITYGPSYGLSDFLLVPLLK